MTSADDRLDEVREVLFGAELDALRERIESLEARNAALESMLDAQRPHTIGEVLPEAVRVTSERPGALGEAMRGEVVHSVHSTARHDSDALAAALYPVLGPAIRKMVIGMFPFGPEEPPSFRVSQVFLMERSSGVLLAGVADDGASLDDADMVTGMLDAVRMFVQDAFGASEHDGLHDLRVGETTVVLEWGPDAVLAAVVDGIPTHEFRLQLAEELERIHRRQGDALTAFDGDVSPFASVEPDLERLRAVDEPVDRRVLMILLVIAALVAVGVVLALTVW